MVARDFVLGFAPTRIDHFEYRTGHKWSFARYLDFAPKGPRVQAAFAAHGGEVLHTRHPWADLVVGYGRVVYLPGRLAGAGARRARRAGVAAGRGRPETRPLALLLLALGVGLVLVPDLTAEFTWRYQLPLVVLAPPAAALALTRTRARTEPGTVAAPGTERPDDDLSSRARDDVAGTAPRSPGA